MTRIVDWATHNTRVVIALLIAAVVAGIISFITIPKEADPDIPIPMIVVQIPYPGISPEDSERLLIKPMETYLRSIEGLKTITSRAYEGVGVIILEFDVNFNKQKALEDVRAQVETARAELPQDVKQPIVQEFNTSLFPVISVALSGEVPERTLLKIARDLRDQLKLIPSVLDATISGERQEMLEIDIDPAKLESYGITQAEMFNAIATNNRLIAAGSIDTGHGSFAVKVPSVIETPNDVLSLPIRSTKDATVTLGDVAQVHKTFYDATSYARLNGQPTIALDVTKRIGANIIDNNRRVREIVDAAAGSWPRGIHVTYLFDESKDIHDQLGSLSDSIILAVILVMIIVVAALGLRSGLYVGAAIPTSFLLSFLVLNGTGMTLNFMILFAMLLAVGILVDGPIIIVEYADRKMTEGFAPREAFAEAARRMFWPVVSATATMIAAFFPLLFWPDVTGKFMSYFPITLIIVLSASMVVALVFLPVLGGVIPGGIHGVAQAAQNLASGLDRRLGGPVRRAAQSEGISHAMVRALRNLFGGFGRWLDSPPPRDEQHEKAIESSETGDWREIPGITGWYAHLSERLTRSPGKVACGAVAVVVAIVGAFIVGNHGVEFFVKTDPDFANILVSARGNLSANEKRDLVMGVERIVATVDGLKSIYATSGGNAQFSNRQGGVPVDNIGQITIEMKDYGERRRGEAIIQEIQRKTSNIPGVKVEVRVPESGPPTGKDVMIEVSSDDYVALAQTTAMIRHHMDGLKELRDLEDTRPLPGIEWDLKIDRDVASRFGANAQTIGTTVQLVTDGILVGEYRPDDSTQQVDIRVRYPAPSRGIHALDDVRVATASGMVPISNFVKLAPAQQVNSIERVDGHRVYHIRANLDPKSGVMASAEVAKLKNWISRQTIPSSVHVNFKGADEEQNKSGLFLIGAAFSALFLIGLVLVAMFNKFYHAFLILVAVVLAMIGALLGMLIMGQSFSLIMSGTGMLALAGIVVNHNIVLIDTFHRLVDGGMNPIEAVIRSSAQRLRPVFLTTVTAIGGLFPMMLAIEIDFWTRQITIGGPNGMMWIQLSTAIVYGLAFSKMITLGLVPAMLALPYRIRETHRGFVWLLGLIFVSPVRWVGRQLSGRSGTAPEVQPAE